MITAGDDLLFPLIRLVFIDQRICSMAADIVEGLYFARLVLDQEEIEAGHVEPQIAARFCEAKTVRRKQPSLREDGSSFKVVEGRLRVPGIRENALKNSL
jgi:hypothetical protein